MMIKYNVNVSMKMSRRPFKCDAYQQEMGKSLFWTSGFGNPAVQCNT